MNNPNNKKTALAPNSTLGRILWFSASVTVCGVILTSSAPVYAELAQARPDPALPNMSSKGAAPNASIQIVPDDALCSSASSGQVAVPSKIIPLASIASPPAIVASDSEIKFLYLPPQGENTVAPDFKVFAKTTPSAPGDQAHSFPLQLTGLLHPPVDKAEVKALGNSAANAYELTVLTQPGVGPQLDGSEKISIFDCGATVNNAHGVRAVAEATVRSSDRTFAAVYSVFVMFIIYLLAVTVKWAAGKAGQAAATKVGEKIAADHSQIPKVRVSHRRVEIGWWRCWDPVVLSADIFNRASLSQLQILFFLVLVGYSITCSLLRTGTLSELSGSIVYLLGIPALGALGSQATNSSRGRFSADNWAWLVGQHVLAIDDPGTGMPEWRYVLMTGSNIDLYKLQAFTFTLIVGTAMIYTGASLETFTVPDTLLQILGLSQVVFVGGRFAQPATVADADAQVTELRKRANDVRVAATTGIDVDANGQPLRPVDPNAKPNVVLDLTDARRFAPNAVARYSEKASNLKILLQGLTYRDVVTNQLDDPFQTLIPK